MTTATESWTLLDPTLGPTPRKTLSPRLESLAGKRLGVIWNGRPPGDLIFDQVFDILRRRHDIGEVVLRRKPYLGNIAPDEILDELSAGFDAVVTGVGD